MNQDDLRSVTRGIDKLDVEAKVALAKAWGAANGYTGRAGGWIYNASGKPVAQGWVGLWFKYRARIAAAKEAA